MTQQVDAAKRRSLVTIATAAGVVGVSEGAGTTAATPTAGQLEVEAAAFGFSPRATPAQNALALQKAIDAAAIVWLPASPDPLAFLGPVKLRPGTIIRGGGTEATKLASTGDTAFVFEPVAGWEVEGPRFQDFSLHCARNGLVMNDPAQPFADRQDTQRAITRSRFERIRLTGSDKPGSIGLQLSKLFDTVLDQIEVRSFDIGIQLVGSDLCELRGSSRIWLCDTLIDLRRPSADSNYGSGFTAIGCDLLVPRRSFIRSQNHHLTLDSCYLEHGNAKPLTGPAIDLQATYMVAIRNCRLELPQSLVPVLLRQQGEAVSFAFRDNSSRGDPWGRVDWNGDGSWRYWWNTMRRQSIMADGNGNLLPAGRGGPLDEDQRQGAGVAGFRTPWVFSPFQPGLLPADYGLKCRVRDGAFVIPARPGYESQLRFGNPARPLGGRVAIHLNMRATRAGQQLKCSIASGSRFQASETCSLATEDRWFTVHRDATVANLEIALLNDDVKTGGEILLSALVVERTG